MLAAVYYGPDDLRVEEARTPEVEPGDVLLRVLSASICGTDLRILHGQHRMFPAGTVRIPGHEMVGEVVQAGSGVNGLEPGQRVFAAPNWGCGTCRQCVSGANNLCASYSAIGVTQDGAFAEYVLIPAAAMRQGNLMPISEAVDPAVAALVEPFACVLRGQNALGIRPGETVLVIGAGPIGLMHVALARLRGAGLVIVSEPNQARREQAAAMGADHVIDPSSQDLEEAVRGQSGREGADAVIVAAPTHTGQEAALRAAAIGGRINFFGGLPKDKPSIAFDFEPGALQGTGGDGHNGLLDCRLPPGGGDCQQRAGGSVRFDQRQAAAARGPGGFCPGGGAHLIKGCHSTII